MNSKMVVAGVIAGVAFFFLGYLIYGMLLVDMMNNCTTCQRPMEELNMVFLVIGALAMGCLLSYILSKWASVTTFTGGATAGGTIGLLLGIGMDSMTYATTTMYNSVTCIIYDIIILTVVFAIMGGLIGWWLGRK
jgi:hypothetical protein